MQNNDMNHVNSVEQEDKIIEQSVVHKEQPETEKQPAQKVILTDSSKPLSKLEGVIMFGVTVATVLVCSFGVNYTLNANYLESQKNIDDLEFRMSVLENKLDVLEDELLTITEDLNKAIDNLNKKPINITINGDGSATVNPSVPDENPGDITTDPNFDTRPFLGVAFGEDATAYETPLGLKIGFVYENSPAFFAGIKEGDILTKINGISILTFDDLDLFISQAAAGDVLSIEIITTGENGIEYSTVEAILTYRGNFELE